MASLRQRGDPRRRPSFEPSHYWIPSDRKGTAPVNSRPLRRGNEDAKRTHFDDQLEQNKGACALANGPNSIPGPPAGLGTSAPGSPPPEYTKRSQSALHAFARQIRRSRRPDGPGIGVKLRSIPLVAQAARLADSGCRADFSKVETTLGPAGVPARATGAPEIGLILTPMGGPSGLPLSLAAHCLTLRRRGSVGQAA
jgi:hypothetical protein